MGLLIAAAALLFGYGAAYVASDDVRYLTRAGFEETRILTSRVPISRLAHDSTVPDSLRRLAALVVEVRAYAARMGLEAKETYTTYSDVGRDTLLLVLTVSPKTCLCPVTWKYPIAGRIPYKGFFDFAAARKVAANYAAQGNDVSLRPSPAFSTLGWFNDPLLSTAVTTDSVEMASLVFHELAHNTLWVPDATDFNESFAEWVGYRTAERYFLARGDTALAIRAADRLHDEEVLGGYYARLLGKLDSLYGLHLPAAQNDSGRTAVARWSRDTLAGPLSRVLRTVRINPNVERPINNAALMGVRLYRTELPLFDRWNATRRGDLATAIFELHRLLSDVRGPEAFKRMRAILHVSPQMLSTPSAPDSSVPVPE